MLLRAWSSEDVALVREASRDSYVRRMLGLRSGCGERAAGNWIRRTDACSQVIEVDGQGVGEVDLTPDAYGYSAQLSYWVLARFRGRGLAERAARLACGQADGMYLTAYVSARNLASIRVLERLGFQRGRRVADYAGYPGVRDTDSYFRLPLEKPQELL